MLRVMASIGTTRVENSEVYKQESQDRMQEYQSQLNDTKLDSDEEEYLSEQVRQEETLQSILRQ